LLVSSEGSDLVTRIKITLDQQTFFDRFAGFFHSFACLEREVREQLLERRENEATYRLFGRKYDSLGTLVDRVVKGEGMSDDVDRYVILLCAEQLLRGLGRDFPEFWKAHSADVEALRSLVARRQDVRERLIAKDPNQMTAFLDWFDRWFVKRASPLEVAP
jgi:hypothetical protein